MMLIYNRVEDVDSWMQPAIDFGRLSFEDYSKIKYDSWNIVDNEYIEYIKALELSI